MELKVYKNTTIKEIKEHFSKYFPFLKLEVFVYRHHSSEEQFGAEIYKGLSLKEASEFFKEGTIFFSPSTTVEELEQEFQIELGLAVKVLRRSIDTWVNTTQTYHLSLGKQNNMGGSIAKPQFNLHTLFL